ncbi:WecB/TagA/CpsF family glycosyltransferase [Schlesneria sp.]|uniref:WecB/TagA/CpsF family glycosyltransferase n=1 Tax=Schlesneria sp. TaxID=2762018 RepID=UPI002F040A68
MLHTFDDYDITQFMDVVASFGDSRYGFVVTPNTDHLIRLNDDEAFLKLCQSATYLLLDSRFLSLAFFLTKGMHIPVCPGSDLTESLFEKVIKPDDPVLIVGATPEQARFLENKYSLTNLSQYTPPMGFIKSEEEVLKCLEFVEAHSPFRYCFIALGSPQQEILASRLAERGVARGLALCIGASVNFLTGTEQRAPMWMRAMCSEWMYRLLQNPRRMWWRYLVRGPRIFWLMTNLQIKLRTSSPPTPKVARSPDSGSIAVYDHV